MLGIDGHAIDMAAMLCGVLAMLVRPCRLGHWNREKAIADFLNGTSVVPFVAMAASVLWVRIFNLSVKLIRKITKVSFSN